MESISQLWQTPMRLWRKIWRSEQSTLRSVTLLLSGSALSQALPILVSPIVTRLYSPADFGVFAIFSTVLGLIGPIANLRYDLSIVMPDDETKAVELAAIGIYVAALLSLFLQAVEPAAASLLVTHFGYSSAARLLLLWVTAAVRAETPPHRPRSVAG